MELKQPTLDKHNLKYEKNVFASITSIELRPKPRSLNHQLRIKQLEVTICE